MSDSTDVGSAPTGASGANAPQEPPVDDLLVDDLLVEEISIDGMCGVY